MRRASIAVALLLLALPASAQRAPRIDLGGGLAVERVCQYVYRRGTVCDAWTPVGFSFGNAPALAYARAFARVPATGAIVASVGGIDGGILRTEDGAHWTTVDGTGSASPTSFAFDHRTGDGVGVGDGGHVWTTRDAGRQWIDHGGSITRWRSVAIADGEIVLVDTLGVVLRTRDGFSREPVTTDPTAWLEQRDDEIVVHAATGSWVVRRGEPTRRQGSAQYE